MFGTQYPLIQAPMAGVQTSAVHRSALKSDAARHTALTTLFSGRHARGIMNRIMREASECLETSASEITHLLAQGFSPSRLNPTGV